MRARALAATAFALLALLPAVRGLAQEPLPDPDWIPSLDMGFEAFDWDSGISVENLVNGPAFSGAGSDALRQLVLRLGGDVAGPRLSFLPGRPRLFMGGGVGFVTDGTVWVRGPQRASSLVHNNLFPGFVRARGSCWTGWSTAWDRHRFRR